MRGSDFPSFDNIQSMPNCYVGEAKHGMYIPLKLTKTCQQWHSNADTEFWTKEDSIWGTAGTAMQIPKIPTTIDYPFPGLSGLWIDPANKSWGGVAVPPMGNDVVASVAGRNLSVDSSLIVEFRYGFEVQAEPGTELTPFLHLSPPHDSVALSAYSAVSRELKDAYPAEFNDLGKLWDVIRSVARVVAPALMAVPKVGPILSGVVGMIGGSPTAANKEREKQVVNEQIRNVQQVRRRPRLLSVVTTRAPSGPPPAKAKLKVRSRKK